MKRFLLILLIILNSQCYKFEENPLDPNGIFGILRSILGKDQFGYTDFMKSKYYEFRKAGTNTFLSYARRTFDGTDDPRNRVDLILANENTTDLIPTNIPVVGAQYADMIGYGYNPSNASNKYSILFELGASDAVGNFTYQYYYWSGSVLPTAGSRMTFVKVDPSITGEKIIGFGTYNVGAAEKAVFCEKLPPSGSVSCYNVNSDFSGRLAIAGVPPVQCGIVGNNLAVGWCADSITGTSLSMFPTDGSATAFGAPAIMSMPASYKTAPYATFLGNFNFDVPNDFSESHFVEHNNGTIRITTVPGDLSSIATIVVPGNGQQAIVAVNGIADTDVIFPVRSFRVGTTTYLSLITNNSLGGFASYSFRTSDAGVNWAPVSFSGLTFPNAIDQGDPVPSQTSALASFGTNSGTEKIHIFINIEGESLKRYMSSNFGATWTLQETITPSPE
ncbi:hypothetical protein JWG45_08675 [Leptospira sp. 201903070]|uniref:Exo-alpha-sialidase n=1 Tax=Leptospira ainlahdjerensis TaxID=2810033 RepID=A0ABS2UAM8_9LEPT|nr:hypothetical protein [Leptospira ainlahdjerensis]MBM9577224.1 hypothetical protein [Leptospira ainlahdjerensis]